MCHHCNWASTDPRSSGQSGVTRNILKLIHTATPDTTKLSCQCRGRFGGVNWITTTQESQDYWLTVQTLPDGLEIQFTPPDTTRTGLSCRVWLAVWIGALQNILRQSDDHLTSRSSHDRRGWMRRSWPDHRPSVEFWWLSSYRSSSSISRSRRGPSRRCTTMSAVDSTSPEISNWTCGIVT